MFWKTENRTESIAPKDIVKAYWMGLDRETFQLKLEYTTKASIKFDGFRESDYSALKSLLLSNFGIELEPLQVSTKGDNHGELNIQGSNICFTIDGKYGFEIPLAEVAGSKMTANAKNDVVVEFNQESALDDEDEQLMEIRFFIPNIKEGSKEDGTDDKHNPTTAQVFHEVIKERTAINTISGANFCRFPSVHLLTPRGRYDIEMFPNFMKFHGKSHDYHVRYDQITRLFQLPKSEKDVFFIVSLDPPIRRGGTRYQHLVMQFEERHRTTLSISLPPELEERFKELPREFNDEETFVVVNKVFHGLTQQKVTLPSSFKSKGDSYAIKCSMRANDGYLYPLAKSFFFIPKPALYIRFGEIASVEFARAGNTSSNRTFDFVVTLRDGESHTFVGVQKSEYEGLFDFIRMKNIRIENQEEDLGGKVQRPFGEDEDESADEDFEEGSQNEEDVDEDFRSDKDSEEGEDEEGTSKKGKDKEKGKEKEKDKAKSKEKRKTEGHENGSKRHKSDK